MKSLDVVNILYNRCEWNECVVYTYSKKIKWTKDEETKVVKASINVNSFYTRCINRSYLID